MSDTQIGISRKQLIACLYSQGFHATKKPGTYDKRMEEHGKSVIMRFEIEQGDHLELYARVDVYVRVVGEENGFQLIGKGSLRQMRIAPQGKILGIASVPKKQAFDRKKYRAAIADGKTYKRGD